MQSRLNLRPSGKLTHGGDIKDNEDGVKRIKEQGKDVAGDETFQGQKGAVGNTPKAGAASQVLKKLAEEAKKEGPFE